LHKSSNRVPEGINFDTTSFSRYNAPAMKENENHNSDEETVLEEETDDSFEPELEDIEEAAGDKLKKLRDKLKACDEDKRQILEELQRSKADFLNSRKRLENQLERDRERITTGHIEELLPLKDSFDIA